MGKFLSTKLCPLSPKLYTVKSFLNKGNIEFSTNSNDLNYY